jgi:phosphate transport system permease protein
MEERIFRALMAVSILIVIGCLVLIVGTIIWKGLPAMSLSMITQIPKGGYYLGKEGGILNAIIGSLYLASGATVLAILFSLPVVLYINVYTKKRSRLASLTRRPSSTAPSGSSSWSFSGCERRSWPGSWPWRSSSSRS